LVVLIAYSSDCQDDYIGGFIFLIKSQFKH
jgi:hypothetical protein